MQKKKVLDSAVSIGTYREFIEEIFFLVEFKIPSYVCFANVHMLMEARKDKDFQKVLDNANIVTPDGRPLSLFLHYFENIKQERVCGMDTFPILLRRAEESGRSVYFYGSTDDLLTSLVKKVNKEFPLLNISGWYSPPFRPLSEEENAEICKKIRATSPDLVFVSLGCPKQEKWTAKNRDAIGACLLGVGNAFSVYTGDEKRLPKWAHNLSLEWVYRLLQDPKRLWKRYLYYNSHFLLLTLKYLLGRVTSMQSALSVKAKSS
jgi:N-acetylglucosaminyldiphosphoundecaprenol N-acetyl-beta-D-mannosaminyltransferase